MKTEVEMKRELFGCEITQKSKSEFFSSTDLVRAGNTWRELAGLSPFNVTAWLNNKSTKEFIEEIKRKHGKAITKGRGKGHHTWVHPLLFIDMALAISPKLKIEVYEWLFDHLIKSRNDSGDSYKLMCGNLYVRHGHKKTFHKFISEIAIKIKHKCIVIDWQEATETQLDIRNEIHGNIALLADVLNNNDEAVRIALSRKPKQLLKG
jgi:hypothetical protein